MRGYEIHHGRVVRSGEPALIEPCRRGRRRASVLGTHWHGLLENDGFRRAFLRRVAEQAGRTRVHRRRGHAVRRRAGGASWTLLGDLVEQHLNTPALEDVIRHGAPAGLPIVTTGLAGSRG